MSLPERTSVLTEPEARELTDRIRQAAEQTWALLLEAHEGQAWTALGYGSFSEYATAEFGMSEVHAYRLLSQGGVIRAIEQASGLTHGLVVSEREARDLKPHLAAVTDAIRERVADTDPERVAEIVKEVIVEERQKAADRRAENEAVRALNEEFTPPGFDIEANKERIYTRQSLIQAIDTVAGLPSPAEVIDLIPDYLNNRFTQLDAATSWLTEFRELWEAR